MNLSTLQLHDHEGIIYLYINEIGEPDVTHKILIQMVKPHGGEGGVRTPGPARRDNGFRGRRIQPLCHLSS